jgi:hypothetical protein
MRIFYNIIKLRIAIILIASIDRKLCNEQALWDSVQNEMERIVDGKPIKLHSLARSLYTLASRADERAEDIVREKGYKTLKV